jgi:metal-responsive CopG/Arc/MetJ family transcriptional regulator
MEHPGYIPHGISEHDTLKAISLKLPDELLEASAKCAHALGVSRAEYIRGAIQRVNHETRARLRAQRLAEVSHKVRAESMRVNAEFAVVEHAPDLD